MGDMFTDFAAPFHVDAVSWRVGNTKGDKSQGMALAFIDARDVMGRLDEVVGPDGWERRHPHVEKTTTCELAIWIEGRGWVVKTDGAGDTDYEAEKGSLSDSFKRAAVNWGIGRYLYTLRSPWVDIEPAGTKSYKIKADQKPKLRAVLVEYERAWIKANSAPAIAAGAGAPSDPAAADFAIKALNSCATLDDMKATWAKNAVAWKNIMSASDFARVEKVKESLKITLATPLAPGAAAFNAEALPEFA